VHGHLGGPVEDDEELGPGGSLPDEDLPGLDLDALGPPVDLLEVLFRAGREQGNLREVGQRLVRLRALARLGEMADRGDFDEFLDDKAAYRR